MKLLITESQRQRLLNEEPFLADILKKAIVRAIESPEVQKIIKKGMENVIERGAGEVKKFTENPKAYIESLKATLKPTVTLEPEENVYVSGEYEDEEVEVEDIKVKERPAIIAKKEEIERSKRYIKELSAKKGYKSKRDRDNIDLLNINVAKLERDLQTLYNEE